MPRARVEASQGPQREIEILREHLQKEFKYVFQPPLCARHSSGDFPVISEQNTPGSHGAYVLIKDN